MRLDTLARYGLWCGVIVTAAGNRRQYRMTTTWLPHLVTNTVTLLLPDLYRLVEQRMRGSSATATSQTWTMIRRTLTALVRDNPQYVVYVTPLAAGYLLSSPWLNIYKGELGELKLAGFGLDALPHSATAFALTHLVYDTAATAAQHTHTGSLLEPLIHWSARHRALASALVLALATLAWEVGEHRIYQHEIAQRGSADDINMQWSMRDTLVDCVTNALGWAAAVAWRQRHSQTAP